MLGHSTTALKSQALASWVLLTGGLPDSLFLDSVPNILVELAVLSQTLCFLQKSSNSCLLPRPSAMQLLSRWSISVVTIVGRVEEHLSHQLSTSLEEGQRVVQVLELLLSLGERLLSLKRQTWSAWLIHCRSPYRPLLRRPSEMHHRIHRGGVQLALEKNSGYIVEHE